MAGFLTPLSLHIYEVLLRLPELQAQVFAQLLGRLEHLVRLILLLLVDKAQRGLQLSDLLSSHLLLLVSHDLVLLLYAFYVLVMLLWCE